MYFGDVNDPDSGVSKIIDEQNAAIIEPEKETKPAVYYCPTRHGRIL
jgi:Fe-S-cluster-containing dehydrogenase component